MAITLTHFSQCSIRPVLAEKGGGVSVVRFISWAHSGFSGKPLWLSSNMMPVIHHHHQMQRTRVAALGRSRQDKTTQQAWLGIPSISSSLIMLHSIHYDVFTIQLYWLLFFFFNTEFWQNHNWLSPSFSLHYWLNTLWVIFCIICRSILFTVLFYFTICYTDIGRVIY